MKKILFVTLLLLFAIINTESRRMSSRGRSSGSSRGSSRRTYSKPAPTSFSNPQPSVAKPSLFGWQEKPAQPAHIPSHKQSHSYPSSNTGLSGGNQPKTQTIHQESIQRSNVPVSAQQTPIRTAPQSQATNQMTHSYPASNGLSGSSKPGGLAGSAPGYPSNAAPPPYSPVDTHRPYGSNQATNNFGNSYQHPQGPPPPYTNNAHNYGGVGGHGYNPGYNPQTPGYFGNYVSKSQNFGGVSRTGSALTGVGIAGAGVGTILTGLALWNLARSTGHHQHTVIYDNRGQPVAVAPSNNTQPIVDPLLGDLINCTLTISNDNATEILAIPCAIATSFTPDANVKDSNINANNPNDTTKCTITVVTKNNREFMTTIPCSILLSTAASNNVTEPPFLNYEKDNNNSTLIPLNTADVANGTIISQESAVVVNGTFVPSPIVPLNQPAALKLTSDSITEYNEKPNCTFEVGEIRDPINPCFSITNDLTVIPLHVTNKP